MGTPDIPKDPKPDIQKMDINEIKESGLFMPQERQENILEFYLGLGIWRMYVS